MTLVVVPVRYPLSEHSRVTLEHAIGVADEHDATLTVLHVNLFQESRKVTRTDLKRAVQREFGRLPNARYVVRGGFLLEETILEEVAAEGADIVVIGAKQAGRWRRMFRNLLSDPDIDEYLREQLDATVVTVDF
ncbi:Nucleotide-binding protein, UspA family [Halalkaliarchaeum sp. AArc-CO]|uniref:universal stress protein n=1 Tax=unclassified Halalkaliarchaeum TaxID=2678344 RepID=UPI00217E8F6F|nr:MULTISPECIES: universal stress protein [unclassified Halalkaliarchaeum]MDR5674066.1 universal stress protein [Halalkaliarchaeum sp. AArc-GB]UWG50797.1 Nucleotide-binding protein, UspA family [Halalkaliarchaeum sp. AArc-CO]